jgi:hypothetical protein
VHGARPSERAAHAVAGCEDYSLARRSSDFKQADERRILLIQEATFPLSEQGIGTDEIRSLTIGLGPREVRIKPVARFLAAPLRSNGVIHIPRPYGRVDMTNGLDKFKRFRTEKDPTDRRTIVEQDSSRIELFDRNSFESAFKRLLA